MVDYRLKEVGESSFEIEWLGKKPKLNMKNLYELYKDMEFISTSGKSKQCSQFGMDLKKALKNDLGTEYDVEISIGHFYISGFVNKVGTDKFIHLLVCVIIAETVAVCDVTIFNRSAIIAATLGVIVAIFVGIGKEVIDFFRNGLFDFKDLKFDCYGAILGGLLAFISLIA